MLINLVLMNRYATIEFAIEFEKVTYYTVKFEDSDLNELEDEEINQILNLRFNNDDILEKDDLNEFLATSTDPDTDPPVDDEEEYQMYPPIPTTNAGEIPFEIEQENERSKDKITVSGHVMLNQNGTVLTRKKHQINGSSLHKFFLQKICATTVGSSIPI